MISPAGVHRRRRDGDPATTLFRGPLGRLAAWLYGLAIARRNRRFDAGRGVVTLDRPVISVGNLSVGGTGKTPMVRHLLGVLREAGRRPCVAMRGYGGAAGESDEAQEYRRSLPDVPIVAQPNRLDGLIRLFAAEFREGRPASDCVVLDDGFQHRRIARQLDLVLIDATRDPFTDRLLPAGWLREPVDSLGRAGGVIVTHAEAAAPGELARLAAEVERLTGRGVLAVCRHAWSGLVTRRDDQRSSRDEGPGEDRELDVSWLRGRRVVAVCAIGNHGPFLAEARRAVGGPLAGEVVLRDHDPYRPRTIRRVLDSAQDAHAIITTEKDWSKLRRVRASAWPCPVVRPQLVLSFDRGGDALRAAVLRAAAGPVDEEADADTPQATV